MPDVSLHLESVRELKSWALWVIGIFGVTGTSTGIIAALTINFSKEPSLRDPRESRDLKWLLFFSALSLFFAVSIINGIPRIISSIDVNRSSDSLHHTSLILGIPVIYYEYSMYASISISGFFALSVLWRTAFGRSFIDFFTTEVDELHAARLKTKIESLQKEHNELSSLDSLASRLSSDISELKERIKNHIKTD